MTDQIMCQIEYTETYYRIYWYLWDTYYDCGWFSTLNWGKLKKLENRFTML